MTRFAPWRVTVSSPLSVSNATRSVPGLSASNTTKAAARVAWPQRSTSTLGVNQRRRQPSPSGTMKAVSDRLFSAAMACIVASSSQ